MIYSHSGHSRSTSLIPPKSRVFTNHKFGNAIDITKCRFAPFRYIGPRVKPAAMHLWLSATSHISRFTKNPSASASTRPHGLREPAVCYTPSKAESATLCGESEE